MGVKQREAGRSVRYSERDTELTPETIGLGLEVRRFRTICVVGQTG
jgi:hypothetical protein